MFRVITTVDVHPGEGDVFMDELLRLAETARGQPGCIAFDATIDTEAGITSEGGGPPTRVTISEEWENAESLKAHTMAPHMLTFLLKTKHLVRTQRMRILQPE
jgi:quinol monooxygenase YgiN